jgi:hypothetical protein
LHLRVTPALSSQRQSALILASPQNCCDQRLDSRDVYRQDLADGDQAMPDNQSPCDIAPTNGSAAIKVEID